MTDSDRNEDGQKAGDSHQGSKWLTFAAMIATSIVTMFVLKYSNVYEPDHIFFSQTRMWMALMMGMAMIVIMLGFMWGMYKTKTVKWLVIAAASPASACSCGWRAASPPLTTSPGRRR
ncbi:MULTISPECIES: hypothetical protein [Pacificimonas]|uniref:hypothetical protein n=1 Tax=Pacificimonas TaxID=1960290 RepID=UPI0026AE93AE|nr:hypothetical protein [Pacificimonas aurantium]